MEHAINTIDKAILLVTRASIGLLLIQDDMLDMNQHPIHDLVGSDSDHESTHIDHEEVNLDTSDDVLSDADTVA